MTFDYGEEKNESYRCTSSVFLPYAFSCLLLCLVITVITGFSVVFIYVRSHYPLAT